MTHNFHPYHEEMIRGVQNTSHQQPQRQLHQDHYQIHQPLSLPSFKDLKLPDPKSNSSLKGIIGRTRSFSDPNFKSIRNENQMKEEEELRKNKKRYEGSLSSPGPMILPRETNVSEGVGIDSNLQQEEESVDLDLDLEPSLENLGQRSYYNNLTSHNLESEKGVDENSRPLRLFENSTFYSRQFDLLGKESFEHQTVEEGSNFRQDFISPLGIRFFSTEENENLISNDSEQTETQPQLLPFPNSTFQTFFSPSNTLMENPGPEIQAQREERPREKSKEKGKEESKEKRNSLTELFRRKRKLGMKNNEDEEEFNLNNVFATRHQQDLSKRDDNELKNNDSLFVHGEVNSDFTLENDVEKEDKKVKFSDSKGEEIKSTFNSSSTTLLTSTSTPTNDSSSSSDNPKDVSFSNLNQGLPKNQKKEKPKGGKKLSAKEKKLLEKDNKKETLLEEMGRRKIIENQMRPQLFRSEGYDLNENVEKDERMIVDDEVDFEKDLDLDLDLDAGLKENWKIKIFNSRLNGHHPLCQCKECIVEDAGGLVLRC